MPKRRVNASEDEEDEQERQPPKKITKNIKGQQRNYHYIKTVKSLEELDKFRFKNYCQNSITIQRRNEFKSWLLHCSNKAKQCDFELRAVRPDLGSGTIHVYAHSQHNHPVVPEDKRVQLNLKEFMPDENPPKIFHTSDKREWQFVGTFANYEKVQNFRLRNQCRSICSGQTWSQIRYHCNRNYRNQCKFIMLVIKTTKQTYHVYKHGKHTHNNNNHAIRTKKQQGQQQNIKQKIMEDKEDKEEEDCEDEDENEEEEHQLNDVQKQKQPRSRIIKNIQGKIRKFHFLKTVKSLEELDQFRFENHCYFHNRKPQQLLNSILMACRKKRDGKTCNFQLLAIPSAKNLGSGDIHVYSHSQHSGDHPFRSIEKQISEDEQDDNDNDEELGGVVENEEDKEEEEEQEEQEEDEDIEQEGNNVDEDEEEEDSEHEDDEEVAEQQKPPINITKTIRGQIRKYKFLKTFKTIEQMDKFRFKNSCIYCGDYKKRWNTFKSIIMPCTRKMRGKGCDFDLMAVRPDLESGILHVYAHSEHNHPIMAEVKRSLYAKVKQLMPDANPPQNLRTPDSIQWTFLQTIPDYDKLHEFRRKNQSTSTTGNKKFWRIRFRCNHRKSHNCKFMLSAMKTTKQRYHVYKHGKHNHRPVHTPRERQLPASGRQQKKGNQAENQEVPMEEDNIEANMDEQEEEEIEDDDEELEDKEKEEKEEKEEDNDEEEEGDENDKAKENDKIDDEEEEEDSENENEDDEELEVKKEDGKEEGDDKEEEGSENDEEELLIKKEEEEDEEEDEDEGEDNEKGGEGSIKMEIKEENPFENWQQETLEEKLAQANGKIYKWMEGIGPTEIEGTIGEWDKLSLLKMVEMADQEIREHPEKLNLWLPWLKCAVPKCLPQIEGFNVRFKNLIKMTFN